MRLGSVLNTVYYTSTLWLVIGGPPPDCQGYRSTILSEIDSDRPAPKKTSVHLSCPNRCDLRVCGFNTDHHKRLIIPRPYPRLMFSYCGGKVVNHAVRLTGAVGERSLDAVDLKHLTGR